MKNEHSFKVNIYRLSSLWNNSEICSSMELNHVDTVRGYGITELDVPIIILIISFFLWMVKVRREWRRCS